MQQPSFRPGRSKVVAEIGQNHNGSLALAKELMFMAFTSGCFAVKTAKRNPLCWPEEWKTREYVGTNSFGQTYWDHRMALELKESDFESLRNYAGTLGFPFISSFTDRPSLDFLMDINVDILKIASSRAIDYHLLSVVNKYNKPVILSTGMCTKEEVDKAIICLKNVPYLAVLQCTSSYPVIITDINLKVIDYLTKHYNHPVGLSLHSQFYEAAYAARGMGAEWFEFHITFHRRMKGTDQGFALTETELSDLCLTLNRIDIAMGSGIKTVADDEINAITKLRSDLEEK